MATIAATVSFDSGRVVSRTFGAIGRNAGPFFALSAALIGAPQLLLGLIGQALKLESVSVASAFLSIASIGLTILTYWLLSAAQAALVWGVVEDQRGRRPDLGQLWRHGAPAGWAVFAISLGYGIAVVLGAIFLVVPGLIIAIRWIAAVPVRSMEGPGISRAFSRSSELTRGCRWQIFWLTVALGLVSCIALATTFSIGWAATPGAASLTEMTNSLPFHVANGIVAVLTNTLFSAGLGALYCELGLVRDGVLPTGLAEVFD